MNNRDWKEKDKEYLRFIQKFLDLSDNIENKELKDEVIRAMLMCDERLTQLAELEFENLNKN
ncbi:unknown [Clostridium sp. CAG:492]|nr:unknown [Clostridium sp. CAG:492]